jgi:hypothetical protein
LSFASRPQLTSLGARAAVHHHAAEIVVEPRRIRKGQRRPPLGLATRLLRAQRALTEGRHVEVHREGEAIVDFGGLQRARVEAVAARCTKRGRQPRTREGGLIDLVRELTAKA